jgi:D-xylose transport system permease protein
MNKQKLHNEKKNILGVLTASGAREYMMVIVMLLIWAIFSLLTNGLFMSARNLSTLFMQMCTIGILACGMVFIMVTGNIDISVGSVLGTLGALMAVLNLKIGLGPVFSIFITLLGGILVGLWHGYWIAYRKVPAMIATLSSMTAFKGLTLFLTGGITIGGFAGNLLWIGKGYLPKLFLPENVLIHDTSLLLILVLLVLFIISDFRRRVSLKAYGLKVPNIIITTVRLVFISFAILAVGYIMITYRGIPNAIIILAIVVFSWSFIGNHTSFGRAIYAIGGSSEAARMSGINIQRTLLINYAMMGLLTAMAALVFTTRLNAATTTAGTMFEMDAIAASVIGGTSPAGGVGTVFGAIIGALIMASLDNGMSLLNVDILFQYLIKGLVLLVAVAVDSQSRNR